MSTLFDLYNQARNAYHAKLHQHQTCSSFRVVGNFLIQKYKNISLGESSRSKVKVKCHQNLITSRGHDIINIYTKLHQFLVKRFLSYCANTLRWDKNENNSTERRVRNNQTIA